MKQIKRCFVCGRFLDIKEFKDEDSFLCKMCSIEYCEGKLKKYFEEEEQHDKRFREELDKVFERN